MTAADRKPERMPKDLKKALVKLLREKLANLRRQEALTYKLIDTLEFDLARPDLADQARQYLAGGLDEDDREGAGLGEVPPGLDPV